LIHGREKGARLMDNFLKPITFSRMLQGFSYNNDCRTILCRKCEPINGVIIGRVIRYEGNYHAADDWEEQGCLYNRKGTWFWVVAVSMNRTCLVPVGKEKWK
jgi:hypothetical protein